MFDFPITPIDRDVIIRLQVAIIAERHFDESATELIDVGAALIDRFDLEDRWDIRYLAGVRTNDHIIVVAVIDDNEGG